MGISFLYDGTFRNLQWNLAFIRRIMEVAPKSAKAKICILLVDTDVSVCLERALSRAEKEGRPCPQEFVTKVNSGAKASAFTAKDFAHLFVHVSNNGDEIRFEADGANENQLADFINGVERRPQQGISVGRPHVFEAELAVR